MTRRRRAARLLRARSPFGFSRKIKRVRLFLFPIKRVVFRQNNVGMKKVFPRRTGINPAPSFRAFFDDFLRCHDSPPIKTPIFTSPKSVIIANDLQFLLTPDNQTIHRYSRPFRQQKYMMRTHAGLKFFLVLARENAATKQVIRIDLGRQTA